MRIEGVLCLALAMAFVGAGCGRGGGRADDLPGRGPTFTSPAGTYSTQIPAGDFKGIEAAPQSVLKGRWELRLDEVADQYVLEQRKFGRDEGELTIAGTELVFDEVPAPQGTFNCFDEEGRTTRKGWGVYTFRLQGDELELFAERELCPLREVLLARTWQRL